MKVKNFKINVVVDEYGKKTLMTVEDNFTIRQLKWNMNLPEGCELWVEWNRATDDCIIEDWDLVEVRYDILTILDKMQKDIVELRELVNEIREW